MAVEKGMTKVVSRIQSGKTYIRPLSSKQRLNGSKLRPVSSWAGGGFGGTFYSSSTKNSNCDIV